MIGSEFGKMLVKKVFLNGFVLIAINRKLKRTSDYPESPEAIVRLNGVYEGTSSISTDVGIALGYFNDPVMFAIQLSHPVFIAGRNNFLQDCSSDKIKDRSSIFPADFHKFYLK